MAGKSKRSAGERLARYRAKRSADRSPEPFGNDDGAPRGVFAVQKHAARRLHYDLRLEYDGVLLSWAVPHGPSLDPAEKRLAVHTEDHPLEYASFEGVIPAGNYGAGAMILWDRGGLRWIEPPDVGLGTGKLLFELAGYKLGGVWTLVRIKGEGAGKEWLLIKKPDGYARAGTEAAQAYPATSILSGLTVEELAADRARGAALAERALALGGRRRSGDPLAQAPMLAEVAERPFSDPGWLFELKYDGYRLLAWRRGERAGLRYRSGRDATELFPEIEATIRALPVDEFIVDGEVVVLAAGGRASFHALQRRAQLRRRADVRRATVELPATLFAFDLLSVGGVDLRKLALRERKALLAELAPRAGPVRFAEHIEERGEAFYAEVARMGLEGVVAKRTDSVYRAGRSPAWLKLRVEHTADFAVVGFTAPRRGRRGFGALELAFWEDGGLCYAGRVGTGFDDATLAALAKTLATLARPHTACRGTPPGRAGQTWVEPALVVEVRFKELTAGGQLRHPVFLRVRDDKEPHECPRPGSVTHGEEPEDAPLELEPEADGAVRSVKLTNLDKVFWPDPEDGFTKGDLVEFYRRIAPSMLPNLRDRPVVLTRYPDGIYGKSFFQKDAPPSVPGWVRLERMWSEHAQREIDYFVCDDVETLVLLAQLGSIPLHVWSSRVATLAHPDWCILDLDPKGAPFAHVVELALALRELCEAMGIDPFVKTSGATGLHVLVPLGRQLSYEQSRSFAELIARVIVHDHPQIATTTRALGRRGGRVYVDYLQNGHGRLLVAPYSVRPRPGATVSTPLDWDEVGPALDREAFTIRTVPARVEARTRDPLDGLLAAAPDIPAALEVLAARLA